MGNVIELADYREIRENPDKQEKKDLYLDGPAKCLACKHEWMAKESIGTDSFDLVCPKCDTRRGQFIYPPDIGDKHITWQHECGNTYFSPIFKKSNGTFAKR